MALARIRNGVFGAWPPFPGLAPWAILFGPFRAVEGRAPAQSVAKALRCTERINVEKTYPTQLRRRGEEEKTVQILSRGFSTEQGRPVSG